MEKIKILAIVGSLRENSYNRQLALLVKKTVADQADVSLLDYADVPFMNEDIEFPAPESVKRVREEVKAADAIWFFTPEYNHYFPGVLKNLLDWLSRPISDEEPQVLAGKPVALGGITPGMSGTCLAQDHMVTLISFLNMDVMNEPRLTIPNAMQQLDDQGNLKPTVGHPFLEQHVKGFLAFINKRKSCNKSI